MKILIHKIIFLGYLLFGLSLAPAVTYATWEPDVEFIDKPPLSNIACGEAPYNAKFTVKNNEEVGIILYDPKIINNDNFPDNLIEIQNGGLTTCALDNITPLPGGAVCYINLIITPADCPASGVILGDIRRILHVGVDTLQVSIQASLKFKYVPITPGPGPGTNDFAILGSGVHNVGENGIVQTIGSVGPNGNDGIQGGFDVSGGELYDDSEAEPVQFAQDDFQTKFDLLVDNLQMNGCKPHGNLDDGDVINSGYHCLSNEGQTVLAEGTIELAGPGDFVFFITPKDLSCFHDSVSSTTRLNTGCDLQINPKTRFIYTTSGVTHENVYWVVNGSVLMQPDAILDGYVLAGNGPISSTNTGYSPVLVNGRLWSNGLITLHGDTVTIQ